MEYRVQAGNREDWDQLISGLPGRHFLQSWEWGEAKRISAWQPMHRIWLDQEEQVFAAALILTRAIEFKGIRFPLRLMYLPRGPLICNWKDQSLVSKVFSDLYALGREQKVIFIKIDPEVELGRGIPGEEGTLEHQWTHELVSSLKQGGWVPSQEQVQFKNTMVIDLRPDAEQLIATMKQKTRYNIRLASRRGVSIRPGNLNDLDLFFQMYAETSIRDGFTIRNPEYYLTVWKEFISAGLAEPLIAEVDGEPIAGVIIFKFADRAWFMYGMSRDVHREKMPNYLLQWEAMKRAKQSGCLEYDLWGAPDEFVSNDDLWGVYRFKAGLGAEVVRLIGAWDFPLNRLLYRSYTQVIPRMLDRMRQRGDNQTRGLIQSG
ncbi:MAG: lipid II:glycine glycyltransferase FemX [Anaerolineales bacterium]|jgi:peptidoglycan pentaglycine glycine transferase (the first glycine)